MFISKVMIPSHRAVVYAAHIFVFALCMLIFLPSFAVPLTACFGIWLFLLELGIQAGGFLWAVAWHLFFTLVLVSAPFLIPFFKDHF